MSKHGVSVSMLLVAGLLIGGCNETPVGGVVDTLTITVADITNTTGKIKLDIVWVIDNSVSMCQEQNSLANNVDTFVEKFAALNLDLRMAVITTDVLTEAEQGNFHCKLPGQFPPNCIEREVHKCLKDEDCSGKFGPQWVCDEPTNGAINLTNLNGSINSKCRYLCDGNDQCSDLYGDPDYKCTTPGNDAAERGCILPPDIAGCPTDLPCVLTTEDGNIDLFRCVAIVGAEQAPNPQFEQGLNAALWALDTNPSPGVPDRSLQAKNFIRKDAYQVIIFITDEDDCSLATGVSLKKDDWNRCVCLKTTDDGGPLEPVSNFVNKLKSINADSSKVLVAAIVGDVSVGSQDSLGCPDDDQLDQCLKDKRELFQKSKCGPSAYAKNSYVCESVAGQAEWGSRYLELVNRFGVNGVAANICNDAGFGPALDLISEKILTRVVRVCLPRQVKPGTELYVSKVLPNGETTQLVQNAEDGFTVETATDCPALGPDIGGKAVFLKKVLAAGEQLEVRYEAPIVAE
ncbi:MAG: hypothetical protein HUU55_03110 [Myxococcales bacterium]|nr:hypothetical protein [Myxococcales bacterium]